jgi:hypothetical protein
MKLVTLIKNVLIKICSKVFTYNPLQVYAVKAEEGANDIHIKYMTDV